MRALHHSVQYDYRVRAIRHLLEGADVGIVLDRRYRVVSKTAIQIRWTPN
jgi:hypothetical protein